MTQKQSSNGLCRVVLAGTIKSRYKVDGVEDPVFTLEVKELKEAAGKVHEVINNIPMICQAGKAKLAGLSKDAFVMVTGHMEMVAAGESKHMFVRPQTIVKGSSEDGYGINVVTLHGILGAQPTTTELKFGTAVNMSLAVNEYRGEHVTTWTQVSFIADGKRLGLLSGLRQGQALLIEGDLKVSEKDQSVYLFVRGRNFTFTKAGQMASDVAAARKGPPASHPGRALTQPSVAGPADVEVAYDDDFGFD